MTKRILFIIAMVSVSLTTMLHAMQETKNAIPDDSCKEEYIHRGVYWRILMTDRMNSDERCNLINEIVRGDDICAFELLLKKIQLSPHELKEAKTTAGLYGSIDCENALFRRYGI